MFTFCSLLIIEIMLKLFTLKSAFSSVRYCHVMFTVSGVDFRVYFRVTFLFPILKLSYINVAAPGDILIIQTSDVFTRILLIHWPS